MELMDGGGGKFNPLTDWIVDNEVEEPVREATARACCCCILDPPAKISRVVLCFPDSGGGGSASGKGEGGASHLPRDATFSIKLKVLE